MNKRLGHAAIFKDLEVYKQARILSQQIFEMTKTFPKEERYSLTDQIRRSSRSVGAQIAESWGKRRYQKHFILKLTDADSELYETQHWLEVSFECEYISEDNSKELINNRESIGRMLTSMIDKSSSFCQNSIK